MLHLVYDAALICLLFQGFMGVRPMAKPKPIVDVLQRRKRNEKIYAAIIESGSIRQLAKNIGLGESTIRDVLKGRRKEVQSNTVVSAITRYYPSSAKRTKDLKQITTKLQKMAPSNQRQVAVKGVVFDYKNRDQGKGAEHKLKGKDRRRAFLLNQEKTKVIQIKPNQEGIQILSDLYVDSGGFKFQKG